MAASSAMEAIFIGYDIYEITGVILGMFYILILRGRAS